MSFDFQFPGGLTARVTPVPIPNTEVKPCRADDTARVTARERRSPPGLKYEKGSEQSEPFCFLAHDILQQMVREKDIGICESCHEKFSYYLIHNGFNESAYAYCDTCETTAIFSGWSKTIPAGAKLKIHQRISMDIEPFLKACPCGGAFKADADPRCSYCHHVLSPILAKSYLEANAPGTKKGWRWHNSWSGLYSIVIDDKMLNDWWKRQ